MSRNKTTVKEKKAVPTIVGAALLLGATAFLSRFLGLIRDRLLAGAFGAGTELDIYYTSFRIPDLIFSFLVLGALSAGFIPLFTKHFVKNKKQAWEFTNNVFNILGILLIALSIIGTILTPQILALIAPGFPQETLAKAIPIARIMYLSTLFLGLSSVFGGVLQGMKKFTVYAIAPLLYNLGIIVGAIIATYTNKGILTVAIGVVIGSFLHLLIQMLAAMKEGWRYKTAINIKDKDTLNMIKMMGPRVAGLAVSQANILVMTAIASTLTVGSITMFNFANNIQYVPISVAGIAFAIAAFPSMSEYANENNTKKMVEIVSKTTRNILFLIIPLSVIFLLLRGQIVRIVLGAGEVDWNQTSTTANLVAFFALSMFAQALIPLFVRIFFAYQNTVTPAVIAIISAMVNIALAIHLTTSNGPVGLAMSFSIASILQLVLLWFFAGVKLNGIDEVRILKSTSIIILSALASAVVIQATKNIYGTIINVDTFIEVLFHGIIAGTTGLITYGFAAWIWKSEEYYDFIKGFKKRFLKKFKLSESADEAIESQY